MKKNFSAVKTAAILSAALIPATAFSLAACDGGGNGQGNVSGLIGRFTDNRDTEVILTNDISNVGKTDGDTGRPYIYTSGIYPLNTIDEEGIVYASSQTLRLKRDYTYEYSYDILLRKVTQDGNTDLTKLEVNTKGTFTYNQDNLSETFYNVELSAPTEGEELRYGASIADEGNIFSWRLNSSANYRLDLAEAAKTGDEPDRYTAGRTVQVERGEDRVLYDNVFYNDILNDIAPFCTYITQNRPSGNDPVIPEPQPEKKEAAEARLPSVKYGATEISILADKENSLEIETSDEVQSVTVDGREIPAANAENGKNLFVYTLGYTDFGKTVSVVAGGDAFDFSVNDYVGGFIRTGVDETLEQKALTAFCVSLLNTAKLNGANVSLNSEQSALVYESKGVNKYHHTNWELRDNLSVTGENKDGFFWGEVPSLETGNGVSLNYNFSVAEGAYLRLSAKFTVGDLSYTAAVNEVKTEGGRTYYTVKTDNISPLDFDKPVTLEVFDGTNKISGEAAYSVTRGIAKADLSGEGLAENSAKAAYSLGKAAAWYANRDNVTYTYLPPTNGTGRYSFALGEYTYNDGRMEVSARDYGNRFGTEIYVNETVTSDTNKETLDNRFTVTKGNGWFYVTLGGAEIDGVRPAANASEKVMIIANGASVVRSVLGCEFGDGTVDASLKSFSDLVITGEKGAVVNVYGNIFAQNQLRIENVTVNVYGNRNVSAVNCGSLYIGNGAALNVKNECGEAVSSSGIVSKGDIFVEGTLRSEDYASGIYLDGEAAKQITVSDGGLYITAVNCGIFGNRPAGANKQLVFNGGESYIRANTGVKYCDLTVGEGALTVIADGAYTVDAEETQVTIRTTSGNVEKGELNLINNYYNEWWDVNYTVKVKNMLLEGGKIYIFGMCKSGVVHTEQGTLIEVKNCDLTVENGQSLKTSYGRGINAEKGDERIEVTNSAKVIFKNCDAAIACWGKSGGENFAVLDNEGLIILDTFKVGLEQWEINSWEMKHTVTGDGRVRTANRLG